MTVYELIKNMSIEEVAKLLATLEYEIAVGDFDSVYDDGKDFVEIVTYEGMISCDHYIRLLSTKIES